MRAVKPALKTANSPGWMEFSPSRRSTSAIEDRHALPVHNASIVNGIATKSSPLPGLAAGSLLL